LDDATNISEFVVYISNIQYQDDFTETQNKESAKILFNIKGAVTWLCEETESKYPNLAKDSYCYRFHRHT